MKPLLIVFLGPTAVGKTKIAIEAARRFDADIISADSRQFYQGLNIGTASPAKEELAAAPHHFIGHLPPTAYYNVSSFERDVLHFLQDYFQSKQVAILVGGSGLYIDAVCKGIDDLPDPDEELRTRLKEQLAAEGLDGLLRKLQVLDPDYFERVDKHNPNRILRALEVCLMTGQPYSSLRKNVPKERNFSILKIGLDRPREELFEIIHQRTDRMMEDGLLEEVKSLMPLRKENALNTVGYKELFQYLDGNWTLELAIEKIKTHTRRYAKRQLTWFRKDPAIHWFHPNEVEDILNFIIEWKGQKGN